MLASNFSMFLGVKIPQINKISLKFTVWSRLKRYSKKCPTFAKKTINTISHRITRYYDAGFGPILKKYNSFI